VGTPHTKLYIPDTEDDLAALHERTRAERDRLAALLAITSHELRHPLHLMRLALARHFPRGDEQAREVMERYIDRMSRVIGDMGDLVRLEQDALPLTLSWTDLTQLLRDVVDAYLPDAAARRIRLMLEGATTPLWIQADDQRLLQVLSNVIDNALKFTPAEGHVLVTVASGSGAIEVRVSDTGHGITADALPNVFDLYATGTAGRGTGIGLTVARRIVELHRGSIKISSDGIDKGTEVVLTLPCPVNSTHAS
jgi:signal transduction histidine kinase